MADALSDLNEMVERVRAEADAAGYQRAWMEIIDIASVIAKAPSPKPDPGSPPKSGTEDLVKRDRAPKGQNRQLVLHAIRSMPNRPASVKGIQNWIADQGSLLPYSSIQAVLKRLEQEMEVVSKPDGRWDSAWTGDLQGRTNSTKARDNDVLDILDP